MQAANRIAYTFNWFYADDKHIAYFNSGANPVRPSNVDPNLPTFGRDPLPVAGLRPGHRHGGHRAAGGAPAGHRPELPDELEQPAGAGLQHRLLVALPIAAARRAHQARHRRRQEDHPRAADQRHGGRRDGRPARRPRAALDPEGDRHAAGRATRPEAGAPAASKAWSAAGAHRIDRNKDGVYEHAPGDPDHGRLVAAPARGPVQADARPGAVQPDPVRPRRPGRGWAPPSTAARTATCTRTSATCSARPSRAPIRASTADRAASAPAAAPLLNSLSDALSTTSNAELYGGQTQVEHDKIGFSAVGGITQPLIPWVNRPTFQQAVEIQGHR